MPVILVGFLMKLESSRKIFEKYSNAKFRDNPSSMNMYTLYTNKVRELILEGLFIMNLYQLDKQSTKFPIWKY